MHVKGGLFRKEGRLKRTWMDSVITDDRQKRLLGRNCTTKWHGIEYHRTSTHIVTETLSQR